MTARTYAYLRVSTDDQDTAGQRASIVAHLHPDEYDRTTWSPEHRSGAVRWQDRSLRTILEAAQPGDTIVVSEISRIARSTLGVLSFLEACAEKAVNFRCARGSLQLDGTLQTTIVVTMLALAAEVERTLLRERTTAALAARRAAGAKLGRPIGSRSVSKLHTRREQIGQCLRARVPLRAIARLLECSPTTLYAYLRANPITQPTHQEPQPCPS